MAEDDWEGWELLTKRLGEGVQIVGDDIFVTNTRILEEGIRRGVANSILIKINQIGTLSETFEAIEMAKRAGYTCGDLAPLRRDGGFDHRRHRGRHQRDADQDRARSAAPTAWPSTTSSCASRRSWAKAPSTPGAGRSTS